MARGEGEAAKAAEWFGGATSHYKAAVEASQDDAFRARSWYWCGRAYAELGDWSGALGCYERACGLANDRMYVDTRDEARAWVG